MTLSFRLHLARATVRNAYWRLLGRTICVARGHRWRAEKEFNSCRTCHTSKANRDFKPREFHRGW